MVGKVYKILKIQSNSSVSSALPHAYIAMSKLGFCFIANLNSSKDI